MRRPCANCPWRVDAPREHWDPEHFREIWRNCQDDGANVMLCHKSAGQPADAPRLICQGWARVMGDAAIGVRISILRGHLTFEEIADRAGPPLFDSFADMLRANNVAPPPRNRNR